MRRTHALTIASTFLAFAALTAPTFAQTQPPNGGTQLTKICIWDANEGAIFIRVVQPDAAPVDRGVASLDHPTLAEDGDCLKDPTPAPIAATAIATPVPAPGTPVATPKPTSTATPTDEPTPDVTVTPAPTVVVTPTPTFVVKEPTWVPGPNPLPMCEMGDDGRAVVEPCGAK